MEDLSQNTKVALKVVEKCSRGLLLAVRRYGYHGKPVVFFFFFGGAGEGGGIQPIPSLHGGKPTGFQTVNKTQIINVFR